MADQVFEGNPDDLAEQDVNSLLHQANLNSDIPEEDAAPVVANSTEQEFPEVLPDNLIKALKDLVDKWEKQEEDFRSDKLREWKLLEHFWEGNQNNVWSEVARDWRPIDSFNNIDGLEIEDFDAKTVNVYRGHGESIVAALSSGVPSTKFFPDDADNTADLSTAKVYSKAAELIQRRNQAPLLLVKALYILWNQGTCAAYNYVKEDPKLGTVTKPVMGDVQVPSTMFYCPECGQDVPPEQATDSYQCPNCGYQGPPEQEPSQETTQGQVGEEEINRINEEIKLFSPLYFTIPHSSEEQEGIPYIRLDLEQHAGLLISQYKDKIKDVRDKIKSTKDEEGYQRWSRNMTEYEDELVTSRQVWIRPWALEEIGDDDAREQLIAMFPKGVYVIFAGEEFLDAREEDLDDHWTITNSPVSNKLLAKAQGWAVKDIQEMTNKLVTMTMDNIEHGISMTLVDTSLLSIRKFKDSRTAPGMIYPVTVSPGQNISNSVFETRPATLSKEIPEFQGGLKEYAQFVSGAFPSIYGGNATGGSGTAREYVESRQQALQRLQILWKTINAWWTEMIWKSTKDYLDSLTYDEKFVKPNGGDSYINVWIRKSEMGGKVGEVIAESSERFPISWIQKADALLNLINMKDENINAAVFHPQNTGLVAQTLGFTDFHIPGDDDRRKQLNEIVELLMGAPMQTMVQSMVQTPNGAQPMMQPTIQSTVPISPELDNHELHKETIRSFLISDTGLQLEKENPMGVQNCMAHWHEHDQQEKMMQMQQMQMEAQAQMQAHGQQNGNDVQPPQGK